MSLFYELFLLAYHKITKLEDKYKKTKKRKQNLRHRDRRQSNQLRRNGLSFLICHDNGIKLGTL
jgi:hypothetical protein